MLIIGMDVHKDSTVMCLLNPQAPREHRFRHVTVATTREGLESVLRPLAGQCRVVFEVGAQAQWVASIVRPLAAEVQVANPSRMPWLFRDGRKNDKLDARKLATLLHIDQVPSVYLPRAEVSIWRSLINFRRTQIKRRTMIKNQIRAMLRAEALRCPHKSLWTRSGQSWLRSLPFDAARKLMLRGLMAELAFVDGQRGSIETQLDAMAQTQPAIALLRTIPGIGPRSAEAIVAYTDRVDRFGNGKKFASYFGMTPTQDASGLVNRHGHISKRGPSVVRWVLVEAVHQVIRRCPVFGAFFAQVVRGKPERRKRAVVATGRKLLTVAFAMLRDQSPFDPGRVRVAAA